MGQGIEPRTNDNFQNTVYTPEQPVKIELSSALVFVFTVLLAPSAETALAAPFQVLHAFNGADGDFPHGNLTVDGTIVYGATSGGGPFGSGTVYAINADGTGFHTIHSFKETGQAGGRQGSSPQGGMLVGGGSISGAVKGGTANESGGHFSVNIDGTGYNVLPVDRWNEPIPTRGTSPVGDFAPGPFGSYRVMTGGGANGNGVITGGNLFDPFQMPGGAGAAKAPEAGVAVVGDRVFGTASQGGAFNQGAIFALDSDGTDYQILHSFDGSDGFMPMTQMTSVDFGGGLTMLFGTTQSTLFYMNLDGTGFTVYDTGAYTSSLTLDGLMLYGTQLDRVFSLDLGSGEITTLHTFSDPNGGLNPRGGVVPIGPWLYGTTSEGGPFGNGTVYRVAIGEVPEPATWVLSAMALVGLLGVARRHRKR